MECVIQANLTKVNHICGLLRTCGAAPRMIQQKREQLRCMHLGRSWAQVALQTLLEGGISLKNEEATVATSDRGGRDPGPRYAGRRFGDGCR